MGIKIRKVKNRKRTKQIARKQIVAQALPKKDCGCGSKARILKSQLKKDRIIFL